MWKYRLPKWRSFCPGGDESNNYLTLAGIILQLVTIAASRTCSCWRTLGTMIHPGASYKIIVMMTPSKGNIFGVTGLCVPGNSPVTGEFPAQRPVTRSFDVFFDLRLNKRMMRLVIWCAIVPIMTSLLWQSLSLNQRKASILVICSEKPLDTLWLVNAVVFGFFFLGSFYS